MKTIKQKYMIKIKILLLVTCLWISFAPTAGADILMNFHLDAWDKFPETSFQVVFKDFDDIIDGMVEPSIMISPAPNGDTNILAARFYFADSSQAAGYMNKVGVYYTGSVEGGQEPGGWFGYPWDHYGTYTRTGTGDYFTLSGVPGTAIAWGRNTTGQLGDGTVSDSQSPILSLLPGGVQAVSAGAGHSLALDPDGTVWAWGHNYVGQLGIGTVTDSAVPVKVKDPSGQGFLTGIVAISAGFGHSLALDKDGKVYGWGSNDSGQLGTDPEQTMDRYKLPREIISAGIRAIAAGQQFSLALGIGPGDEGCVSAWGINDFGQLGRGDYEKHVGAGFVTTGSSTILWNIKSISAGWNHALALDRDGNIWAWGKNEFGQLGFSPPAPPELPRQSSAVKIQTGPGNVAAVSAGLGFSLALDRNADVWAWGGNWQGQLGDGTKEDDTPGNGTIEGKANPQRVKKSAAEADTLGGVRAISAGRFHGLALDRDGKVWAWGDNQSGTLGRDPAQIPESLYAIPVKDYSGQNDLGRILDIAAGNLFSLAIGKRGFAASVSLTSSANPAAPGDTVTFTATVSPVQPGTGTPTGTIVFKEGHTILGSAALVNGQAVFTTSSLAAGPHEITALFSGEHFTAKASDILMELIVVPIRIVTSVMPPGMKGQHYSKNIVFTGGYGPSEWSIVGGSLPGGQELVNGVVLGTPTSAGTYNFIVLVRNSGFTDSRTLTIRIAYPGRLVVWGDPDYDGTLNNLVSVSAGDTHGVVLDAEGKVWGWGNNEYGQLGNGQTCSRNCVPMTVPIQPSGIEDRTFTAVAAGFCHSIALESTGNLWIWGACDSNLPAASWNNPVPMQFQKEGSPVEGITAAALGGNSVWAVNRNGLLYDLNMSGAEPVKGPEGNGNLQDIIAVAAWGDYALALARDGSVYEWGYYYYYDAGGDIQHVNRPFPTRVEVGSGSPLTNIVAIAAGEKFGIALDRNGHVWAWGINAARQLGQGSQYPDVWSQFALPVKNSSGNGYLSDIVSISAGGNRCLALDSRGSLWGWGNYGSLPGNSYTGNPERGYVTGFSAGGDLMAMILSGMGGDLNGDGSVGLADAVLCLKLLAGMPVGEMRLDGGITGEPKIGLQEVLYILQGIAGMRGRD